MTALVLDVLTIVLSLSGALFCISGTVGLLRFPDTFTRLHALTKADNLGLGLIVLALSLQSGSITAAAKLFLIWLLAMLVGSNACFMIGRWEILHRKKEREDDGR